jgi:hypothetical protein
MALLAIYLVAFRAIPLEFLGSDPQVTVSALQASRWFCDEFQVFVRAFCHG